MAAKKAAKIVPNPLQVVTELELIVIQTTRLQLQQAMRLVTEAKAALEQQEANVISKLKAGAEVAGSKSAVISQKTGPCRPKWKDLYVEHFGEEHGETAEAVQVRVEKLYPPKAHDVLVIG